MFLLPAAKNRRITQAWLFFGFLLNLIGSQNALLDFAKGLFPSASIVLNL
jgi:hypothetical protein